MLGIILSIIFPGLGQMYHEKYMKGAIMILMALTPLYPVALIWSIVDAFKMQKARGTGITSKEVAWIVIVALVIAPLFIGLIGTVTYKTVDHLYETRFNPQNTHDEMIDIKIALEEYKETYGQYPDDLYKIVKGRPMRKDWLMDAWGTFYKYKADTNEMYLISAGRDQEHETADDIQL